MEVSCASNPIRLLKTNKELKMNPTKISIAKLLNDFETKTIWEEKTINGKKEIVETIAPKYKKDKILAIQEMDMAWLSEPERGGLCVLIGIMDYVRITSPDGSKTKYFDLFQYTEPK